MIGRLVRLWRAATLANARCSESHLIHARWGELRARHVRLKSQLSLAYVSPAGRVASYQVIRKIRVSAVWRTVFARLGQVMETAVRKETPALFWAIIAVVVLLPLPLGAVYQWSWGLMSSVVGIVLAVWSVRVALGLQDVAFGMRRVWPLEVSFGLVVVWIVLQVLPFTPAGWHHPLWSTTADVLGEETYSAISLNPFDTLSGLVRLLAYAGIFWIALQYCRRAGRARQVLLAIVYSGLAYALYGVAVHLIGSDVLPTFSTTAHPDDVTSTFVDRHSFATYIGLAVLCCMGLLLALLTQAGSATGGKQRIPRIIEVGVGRGWPLLLTLLVLLLALVLSGSRTGFFSTLLGLLSFVLVAGLARALDRRLAVALGALGVAGLGWVLRIGGDQISARLRNPFNLGESPVVYGRIVDAITDSWALGTGFGTFEEAFRFYRTIEIPVNFDMAHSIYLENVLELGIPAASALFCVFVFFLILCAVGIQKRRRDAVYPCVGLAATILVSADVLIDFSLHIPAITATYMLIMGAASAQCWSSRRPIDPW
ncbi:MAG TPA: O-antigen ligase family protein [Casimicrobiaceae bacterium]|nr:O-antigen ligase family protein [Casimicrobiaceae bacterium]